MNAFDLTTSLPLEVQRQTWRRDYYVAMWRNDAPKYRTQNDLLLHACHKDSSPDWGTRAQSGLGALKSQIRKFCPEALQIIEMDPREMIGIEGV